jgi:hypothetical protein
MTAQEHVRAITHAVWEARSHDPLRTAASLLSIAEVLLEEDPIGRTVLAQLMREAAIDLDGAVDLRSIN